MSKHSVGAKTPRRFQTFLEILTSIGTKIVIGKTIKTLLILSVCGCVGCRDLHVHLHLHRGEKPAETLDLGEPQSADEILQEAINELA